MALLPDKARPPALSALVLTVFGRLAGRQNAGALALTIGGFVAASKIDGSFNDWFMEAVVRVGGGCECGVGHAEGLGSCQALWKYIPGSHWRGGGGAGASRVSVLRGRHCRILT